MSEWHGLVWFPPAKRRERIYPEILFPIGFIPLSAQLAKARKLACICKQEFICGSVRKPGIHHRNDCPRYVAGVMVKA